MRRALIVIAVILLAWLALAGLGLFAVERHTGFFAPVWDADGEGIHYVERSSFGVVWGFGWEMLTPPAYSYVVSDEFRLRHLELGASEPTTLAHWPASPVESRITRNYRGRIFNPASARVEVKPDGVSYRINMSIPRVPRSERWSIEGTWSQTGASGAWREESAGPTPGSERALVDGIELLTVGGRESYPAAILAVDADGNADVMVHNDAFEEIYPDGVPAETLAEWSRRDQIEHVRKFRRVQSELEARYEGEGLNEGAATLQAYRDMEELGLLPKRPRIAATQVDEAPVDVRVFEIPADYFTVGLFSDIAEAIASPGSEVDTGTGSYLQYYDDELGPQLRAWREDGNDRFAVRTRGRTYVLTVTRPE
ncbi:MAG TPA: hypothetical protein VMO81_13405 [Aestuariivirgaceae bacterium]|nr:hypothetical protein [Aestuariivirgaceae bacterium]